MNAYLRQVRLWGWVLLAIGTAATALAVVTDDAALVAVAVLAAGIGAGLVASAHREAGR